MYTFLAGDAPDDPDYDPNQDRGARCRPGRSRGRRGHRRGPRRGPAGPRRGPAGPRRGPAGPRYAAPHRPGIPVPPPMPCKKNIY